MQSASTRAASTGGSAKRAKRRAGAAEDVEEMFLAELAARRARLQELLRLIRREVVREMAEGAPLLRPACRQGPATGTGNETPRRAARAT